MLNFGEWNGGVIFFSIVHLLIFLLAAPLLQGWIKKVKAFWQMRQGPSLLQPYRDLRKYMGKEEVISEHASWIFLVTPSLVLGSTFLACFVVPGPWGWAPIHSLGSLFWLAASLGLARFFLALAGLDAGGTFGGMGSSREVFVAALAEPGFILSLVVLALMTETTSLMGMITGLQGMSIFETPRVLALLALFIIVIAEMGRIPVDNPDTHLELTMIHEGMLLDYSGRSLGFLLWAEQLKQLLLLQLLTVLILPANINLMNPSGQGIPLETLLIQGILQIGLIVLLGAFFATLESINVKVRLFRIPNILAMGLASAVLALITLWIMKGGI
ncbi:MULTISPECIES: respiratory chain complex I subunit 1 family protein [Desulfitobacterium]|uniref:Formate hydrogenlyase subunit 4 n=1 Tax=Desulfitobacterium dehalogenans (strain ATCC 51507 / DSM 9161 / JW/IU-DC1) TaxID=756499 RepID=I4AD91_DESDJ|nr:MULTISPECIES: NADH-quinone oxidoreductase subunit H [Desulfitobacterium]AFM01926.1 formate hydrogenlyase subunit 4 [Desulfitobacterium dehalogenans ATCC 51507]